MIKFKGTAPNGNEVVGIGLTRENIDRLIAGQPITISGKDVKLDHDILIMFGETVDDMVTLLNAIAEPTKNMKIHLTDTEKKQ